MDWYVVTQIHSRVGKTEALAEQMILLVLSTLLIDEKLAER
jgi:hypothetical protein